MNLRGKLVQAQAPMVVALVLIAAAAAYFGARSGAAPSQILEENFRSIDAARVMQQSIDAIDRQVIVAGLHDHAPENASLDPATTAFTRELLLQEANITEAGEGQATASLRRAWEEYLAGLTKVGARVDLELHQRRSSEVRAAINEILQLNRDAMHKKSARALRESKILGVALVLLAIIAIVCAMLVYSSLFNEMAARLAEYRASSLGELLDANNRLNSVMDSLADAVVVYDLSGEPAVNNEVAVRALGAEHLAIDRLPEPLSATVRSAFDRVRSTGQHHEPLSLEAAVEIPGSPSPRWILVNATPVGGRSGDVLSGVTVAFRDVTRSMRLAGFRGDLVAAAAHELRTPLTSLHLAVRLCLEGTAGPLSDRQIELMTGAHHDCERLQGVIEELLEMARLEAGAAGLTRTQVNAGELVRDAVASYRSIARQGGTQIVIRPVDESAFVFADPLRLRHVFENLLENAERHAPGPIEIGFSCDRDFVRAFVDDAGAGIPEEWREKVFEKFVRVPGTSQRGTGLGLSIVADIIRAHGGVIGIETSPLGGTRVWFTLPRTADQSAAATPGAPSS